MREHAVSDIRVQSPNDLRSFSTSLASLGVSRRMFRQRRACTTCAGAGIGQSRPFAAWYRDPAGSHEDPDTSRQAYLGGSLSRPSHEYRFLVTKLEPRGPSRSLRRARQISKICLHDARVAISSETRAARTVRESRDFRRRLGVRHRILLFPRGELRSLAAVSYFAT